MNVSIEVIMTKAIRLKHNNIQMYKKEAIFEGYLATLVHIKPWHEVILRSYTIENIFLKLNNNK